MDCGKRARKSASDEPAWYAFGVSKNTACARTRVKNGCAQVKLHTLSRMHRCFSERNILRLSPLFTRHGLDVRLRRYPKRADGALCLHDFAPSECATNLATVRQKKAGRLELTDQTRFAVDDYLRSTTRKSGQRLFAGRDGCSNGLTTRGWAASISFDPPSSARICCDARRRC